MDFVAPRRTHQATWVAGGEFNVAATALPARFLALILLSVLRHAGDEVGFITTGVEYGLHCLIYLVGAPHGAREASVRDLAELQGVPADFLAKVFTKLRRAGLVNAAEGVRGGFSLARSAASISVLDVVEAIDGRRRLFECNEIRGNCALFQGHPPRWAATGVCSIHAVMLEAEKQMRRALAERTLADLANAIGGKARQGYGGEVRAWLESRAEQKVRQPG